ncbi:MAG TPA: helix-turn-helix transcriptional regulator [Longimicrobiales bacterium]|jgi:DNA-binding PadR family transcriptional regulator|nr:helix-turn-helix transcriptional regulator [Longimicrobiales bacterium]
MARDTLGELEQLVLLAVLRVGPGAYGVPVVDEIEDRAERDVAPASVYVTLRRLERKGLVRSRLEENATGRPRRFVEVTSDGLALLRTTRRGMLRMWDGLEPVLGE